MTSVPRVPGTVPGTSEVCRALPLRGSEARHARGAYCDGNEDGHGQPPRDATAAHGGAPAAAPVPSVRVVVPLHLAPVGNRREHEYARARRVRREITTVLEALRPHPPLTLPVTIVLLRVGWNQLDPDGLVGACKAAGLDAVCAWLDVDDRDPRLHWRLAQRITRDSRLVRDGRGRVRRETACSLAIEVRPWCIEDGDDPLRVLASGVATS